MENQTRYNLSPDLVQLLEELDTPHIVICNAPSPEPQRNETARDYLSDRISQNTNLSTFYPLECEGDWNEQTLKELPDEAGLLLIHATLEHQESHIDYQFSLAAQHPHEVASKLRSEHNAVERLNARCHMRQDLSEPSPANTKTPTANETEETSSPQLMEEISVLSKNHMIHSNDKISLLLFQGKEAPALLEKIGRGRAITFAAIGAGSGDEVDLSPEDQYYHHLALWDKENHTVVGAYRIGFTNDIIADHGTSGLYLDHIFNVSPEFYEELGNAMELSRSYILPSYQKNPQMLDALWKGLGLTAIAKQCFTSYGSVTISSSFTPLSQAIIVDTLDRYHSDKPSLRNKVSSKQPFLATTQSHPYFSDAWSKRGINKLNNIIEELEQGHRSIPPLVRYYVSLGAKFLSFQVEKSFNDAIYCLLRVDLNEFPPRYKRRFLGSK